MLPTSQFSLVSFSLPPKLAQLYKSDTHRNQGATRVHGRLLKLAVNLLEESAKEPLLLYPAV